MSIKSTNPAYDAMLNVWNLALISHAGQHAVKLKKTAYLPATSGQIIDGMGTVSASTGAAAYKAMLLGAVYPDLYKEAVITAIGTMHRKPAVIELPTVMESLRDHCTAQGESLAMLLRRINVQQLISGRIGLLGDVVDDGAIITTYNDLSIRNWQIVSGNTRMVVLDESDYVMGDNFEWKYQEQYRVVAMSLGNDDGYTISQDGAVYATTAVNDDNSVMAELLLEAPEMMGVKLDAIPFVFINSRDLNDKPHLPPMLGLADLCMSIYRGEASYRQSLFMQGQDTLVRIGHSYDDDDSAIRTGAGAVINIPLGGDAKYIGVDSSGLSEQRTSLENDYSRAGNKGGALIDSSNKQKESGEALRIRIGSQTTTLPQIALTGAAGLQQVLRAMAPWYNANPDEIVVTPNLDFVSDVLDGLTLLNVMNAKIMGAPLSDESIHAWMREQGATKLNYEDEMERIANEESDEL